MNGEKLTIRPSHAADLPAIAALLDRTFGPHTMELRQKLWRWRFDENPARAENIPQFLVAERDGKIVGVQGMVPLRMKIRDQVVVASCSCDLAVGAEARSAGIKIKLKAMSRDISPLYVSTSANEQANRITLALGGREVATAKRRLVKPLSYRGLLSKIWGARQGAFVKAVALVIGIVLGSPLDLALAAERSFRGGLKPTEVQVEDVIEFDDRFDRFWQVMSREAEIMQVRDSQYLNWRFAHYPFPGIESFALVREGQVRGLGVLQQCIDEDGIHTANILDLLVPIGESEIFSALLSECTRRAIKAGAVIMTSQIPTPAWEKLYRKQGFWLRDRKFSPVTYKNNSDIKDEVFADNRNWYLAMGDGDACYFIA
jgi:N-acetylglutamate synthase-like GNAT family acetyltransferase